MWKFFGLDVIACVGPRQTEIASTTGTTTATITTHERNSKKRRNAHPANTAAQSFAKFPSSPRPSSAKTTASATNTPVAISSARVSISRSGSAISTSSSVSGMTAIETITTAGQSPTCGMCGAATNHATTQTARTANAVQRRRLSREAARPTTCRAA